MKRIALVLLCMLSFVFCAFSQEHMINPVPITDSENFGGRVNSIFQDKLGFMWIGKESGLFRFDGKETRVYRYNPADRHSIGSNSIKVIVEDALGNLWIGTKGGGLNYYNRKKATFTRFLHNKNDPTSISFDEVETICPDEKGNLWIGTDGGGLNYLDTKTLKFKHYRLSNNSILHIEPAGNGNYWLGTWAGGIQLFDSKTKTIKRIGVGTAYEKLNAFCVREVKPGILWIGAYMDGLIAYDIKNNRFSTVVGRLNYLCLRGFEKTAKGEIYAATYQGLFYFLTVDSKYKVIESSLPNYKVVTKLYIDQSQNVWVGEGNGLVGKINSFSRKFNTFKAPMPFWNESILSLSADNAQNKLYFNTPNQLYQYDLSTKNYQTSALPFQYFSSMTEIKGRNALLCISQRQGLLEYNKQTGRIMPIKFSESNFTELFKQEVISLYPSNSSAIWVLRGQNVYQINLDGISNGWKVTKTLKASENGGISSSHSLSSFLDHPNGDCWVGTLGGGLNWLKRGKNRFEYFKHNIGDKKSISSNFIICLAQDQKGNVWVGTQSGLNRFDRKTGTFYSIGMADGLADEWIMAIAIDKRNRVWMSTRRGISMVSGDFKTIRNYNSKDGLPNAQFIPRAMTTDSRGNIYFGGEAGMVWFHPDNIKDNPELSKAAIVDFKVNDKKVVIANDSPLKQSIEMTREIYLEKNQSSFSFQLAALGLLNTRGKHIKFKLEGYDTNWQMAGTDQLATYNNVPWGNYTFMVMVANEDDVWNPEVRTLKVSIARPLLLSNWALLIYFLIIASGVYYYQKKKNSEKPNFSMAGNLNPIQPSPIEIEPADALFLKKALAVVEENMKDPNFGLEQFCDKMNMSRNQLYPKIDAVAHTTVSEFIKEVRLKRAAQILMQNPSSISEVAYSVGFRDPRYFRKCFKQQFGVAPANYLEHKMQILPPK